VNCIGIYLWIVCIFLKLVSHIISGESIFKDFIYGTKFYITGFGFFFYFIFN